GTTVKVGFFLPPKPKAGGKPIRRRPIASLSKGQEALLFLTKHPTKKNVFVLWHYYDVIDKQTATAWKTDVEDVKKAGKLLLGPTKGLTSKDADEPLRAAGRLITRYKPAPTGAEKTEKVPAAQSKLILTALAEADWANKPGRNYQMSPPSLFYRLNLTASDGWAQPKDYTQLNEAAKKWLKDNAGKYRMTRIARERLPAGPSEEPDQ